ncbi:MAG: cupin domain-containing protein [Candidatus Eisenbacteria bacterium]
MTTLPTTRIRWDDLPRERLNDKLERRYISGEHVTLAQFHLAKGCLVRTHAHPNEQLSYVLSGCMRFRVGAEGKEVVEVRGGEVLLIPPGLPHSAEALEDSIVADSFSPVRTDWIEKRDAYLRS